VGLSANVWPGTEPGQGGVELALEAVAVGESGPKAVERIAHGYRLPTVDLSSATQFRMTRSSGAEAGSDSNITKCCPSGITS